MDVDGEVEGRGAEVVGEGSRSGAGHVSELAPGITHHVVNTLGWPDLRPLQHQAITPIRSGRDALLVAPTAGGKTEAAMFPLLSEMVEARWAGMSVLYVTPLRALLNNLYPRLTTYADWIGRRVGLWHGDVGDGERRRMLAEPPDVLLTTPESIEAMLVSRRVDHAALFADVRSVVVDEMHAFAGDDRGWHLLAVLERVQRLTTHRLQRVGMTATVGNPVELLAWLTRSDTSPSAVTDAADIAAGIAAGEVANTAATQVAVAAQPGVVVSPAGETGSARPDLAMDFVGTIANAAKVIDLLHPGEKRLVFCQSRSQTEQLAAELRAREVTTVVSHSSLSAAERRFAESTFADAPECVVVATSTLELGVDIGDLDRVIQIDAPGTVASFLQRLGRTGRRPGSTRNMLFLATDDGPLVQTAALLNLWASGYVEPVIPPPTPWHIAAQQLLALGLQEGRYPLTEWRSWWPGLDWMRDARDVLQHLLDEGYLSFDGGFAILGDAAERAYGRRNFLELTSVFTAAPEFAVLHGRVDIGAVSPLALSASLPAGVPRVLSLAGRGWKVTHVDWQRRRVFVDPGSSRGKSVWNGGSPTLGYELAQAIRDVLVGHDPPVTLSCRASARLAAIRAGGDPQPPPEGTMLVDVKGSRAWWTWAGSKANVSLAAALEAQGHEVTASPLSITCGSDVGTSDLRRCADMLASEDAAPHVDPRALAGLKFSELLPAGLAAATLANRITDSDRAQEVAQQPITSIRV